MLGDRPIIAFVPTRDFAAARAFYEGVLGLRFLAADGFALLFDANGVRLRISKVPQFEPFPFTLLGWEVPDIAPTVEALARRGVRCETFGFPGQDETGVWTAPSGDRVAWFKDPDGNLLSVSQHA
ncbi:MAG: VOC family protein [Thermoanaerobaculia bacterium]